MLHWVNIYDFAIGLTPQNPTFTHTSLSSLNTHSSILSFTQTQNAAFYSHLKKKLHQFRVYEMEAQDYFVGGYYGAGENQFSPEKRHGDQKPPCEPFAIDDLLDFSNADVIMSDGFFDNNVAGNSTDSSNVTAVDSCNSSGSGGDNRFGGTIVPYGFSGDVQLTGELCVPVSNNVTNSA